MNDMIIRAAQDPSCLLAVTPDRGGSWWAALRPGGNYPWPSFTPRNFAEKPTTFADSYTAQDGIMTDDFTLSVDFTLLRKNAWGEINIGCMQCAYYSSTKGYQPSVWILKSDGTKYMLYPVGTSHMTENVASIKVIKAGQNVRMAVHASDGSVVRDKTASLPDGATVTSSSRATDYPGSISAASIRNDTTGKTVWSYPSEAERVRLLTKTNVRTDRGVFEAASTSKRWNVTTPLQAASLLPECTIIVDVDNSAGEIVSYVSCAQRDNPSQGFFVIRRQNSSQLYIGYSGRDSSGGIFYPGYYYVSPPDGECTVALVIDYTSMKICCYINGVEVDNRTMHTNIVAPPEFDETAKPVILGATSGSDGLNSTTKISHCLIFDRALTAAEIAALCPTSN